ncbi:MAG: hypothetical protein LBS84_09325 [Clostridiales bacterium]|nr:hypothetical protein [Clostridiales bacterium]
MAEAKLPGTDYIFLVQTLLHEKNTRALLLRLRSALNQNGHLLIVDFEKNECVSSPDVHNGFEIRDLINILTEIGLYVNNAEIFYHGNDMFMGKDASLFFIDAEVY